MYNMLMGDINDMVSVIDNMVIAIWWYVNLVMGTHEYKIM